MTAQVVRRVRLPADHGSPGAARRAVRAVVDEVGLTDVLDEALLLTTELSTNVVLHARTDLDLEIVADPGSITVTVVDFRPGPITHNLWDRNAGRPVNELAERGRGLMLVDQLATCWGTLHHPDGKGVWFRLDTPNGRGRIARPTLRAPSFAALADLATAAPPLESPEPGTPPTADALADLAREVHLRDQASLAEVGEELLGRLCPLVGAVGAVMLVDEADGHGPRTVAGYGNSVPSADGVRVPLRLSKPWRGELALTAVDGAYGQALAELTAERLSHVVENRRLKRSDSEWRTWLTFLAEVSELLAQSLDVELTLALIPRLVVPRLGHWCAIYT